METTTSPVQDAAVMPAPIADIAALLPDQGAWSEHDYLWLTSHTNHLVEYTNGTVEVLPMPTRQHQAISRYLFLAFFAVIAPLGGEVFYAPLRLQVGPRRFREPDILLLRSAGDPRNANEYWTGADLVVEIVSPDDPARDYHTKRVDYAAAGIPEYWIVDAQRAVITVLRLVDGAYTEHGLFGRGAVASSALLPELQVAVDAALGAT